MKLTNMIIVAAILLSLMGIGMAAKSGPITMRTGADITLDNGYVLGAANATTAQGLATYSQLIRSSNKPYESIIYLTGSSINVDFANGTNIYTGVALYGFDNALNASLDVSRGKGLYRDICIYPGNYTFDRLIHGDSNVRIDMVGGMITRKTLTGAVSNVLTGFAFSDRHDVYLSGIRIDCNQVDIDHPVTGIDFSGSHNMTADHCYISNARTLENLPISSSTISSGYGASTSPTIAYGYADNITFIDCIAENTDFGFYICAGSGANPHAPLWAVDFPATGKVDLIRCKVIGITDNNAFAIYCTRNSRMVDCIGPSIDAQNNHEWSVRGVQSVGPTRAGTEPGINLGQTKDNSNVTFFDSTFGPVSKQAAYIWNAQNIKFIGCDFRAVPGYQGLYLSELRNSSITLTNSNITGGTYGIWAPAHTAHIDLAMSNVFVSKTTTVGIYLDGTGTVECSNVQSNDNLGHGVVSGSAMTINWFGGGASRNGMHGLLLDGVTNSTFIGLTTNDNGRSATNTYDGIYGNNVYRNVFNGCIVRNTFGSPLKYQADGILLAGTSNKNIITSCIVVGNSDSQIAHSGANDVVENNIIT